MAASIRIETTVSPDGNKECLKLGRIRRIDHAQSLKRRDGRESRIRRHEEDFMRDIHCCRNRASELNGVKASQRIGSHVPIATTE